MYPLLLCALLAGAAFLYKCLTLRRSLIMPDELLKKAEAVIKGQEKWDVLALESSEGKSVLSRLIECIYRNRDKSPDQIKQILEAQAREEFVHLQGGMSILETVINVAPMFGILGTASGLVIVFDSFGDASNQAAISVGIARALNTTITGLAIAAPSVVVQMYFSRKLEKLSAGMETLLAELIDTMKNN